MKISFKSLFNVLKYGGTYTAASITCLFSSICFYYAAYRDKALRDVTLDVCISAIALLCCIIQMSIAASSYTLKIVKDTNENKFNNDGEKTINRFIFLHKMWDVFTIVGSLCVSAIGVYVIVYAVLDIISKIL